MNNEELKHFLLDKYLEKKEPIRLIAKQIGCSEGNIYYYLRKFKIQMRNNIWRKLLTKEFLYKEYIINKKSTHEIAQKLGTCSSTIYIYLNKYNIKIRTKSEAQLRELNCLFGKHHTESHKKKISKALKDKFTGILASNWRGGIYQNKQGYIGLYQPKHPKTNRKYIMYHRIVMESHLNKISLDEWIKYGFNGKYPKGVRFLNSEEEIHHINGIKDDNRIENLMLFPNSSTHQQFIHYSEQSFICKFCNKDQRKNYEKK